MKKYDVIVVGGGPSGAHAAIAAARNGASTLLIERYGFLGGMGTAALVGPWMTFHNEGGQQVIQGTAQELVERMEQLGGSLGHVRDTTGYVHTVTPFDPELAKMAYLEMVLESGVELLLHSWVTGTIMDGNRIQGVTVLNKGGTEELHADVVIDATGDGDVAAFAGAEYQVGRKADGLTQPMTLMFVLGNVDLAKVRNYMKGNPGEFFEKTHFDLLDQPHLSVNGFYSELLKAKEGGELDLDRDLVLFFQTTRPDQVTVNMTRAIQVDATNAWQLTQAEITLRRQMMQLVRFFQKRIPGFERTYLVNSGTQSGVRESRRIVGDYMLAAADIVEGKEFPDTVVRSAYPIDIHSPDGQGVETITLKADSYCLPYRVMLPKGVEGLLVVGRCISCTHETLAAVRTQPTVMAMGQVGGTAAALAVKGGMTPRSVDVGELQRVLREQKMHI